MAPLVLSQTNSSDYFEEEDPDFIEALQTTVLPGDINKDDSDDSEAQYLEPPPSTQPSLKRGIYAAFGDGHTEEPISRRSGGSQDDEVYGASHFGSFGEYMQRKRAKLQIQNAEIEGTGENSDGMQNKIFRGLAIYINGWTQPSVQDLRQLIVKHGGIFQPYLDKKSLVTHIITCSLTPAKIREFKHMNVARPEWLVESANAGVLLPWKNFIFTTDERSESTQGAQTKQRSLFGSGIASPVKKKPTAPLNPGEGQDLVPRPFSRPAAPSPVKDVSTRITSIDTPQDLPITNPKVINEAHSMPEYAAHTSNPLAERVMANPEWRKAHTSVASDFIEGFYKNSRLHHLSTWKAELKSLVLEAQEKAELGDGGFLVGKVDPEEMVSEREAGDKVSMRGAELVMKSPSKGKGKGKEKAVDDRVIMHCDFDCFFVSAGLVSRPHLRGRPVVVCHSQGAQGGNSSTSEVASASYEAREYGIKNGMSLQQARKLCPAILTIPYEFERYKQFSLKFYTILMGLADDLQAVSVDEALIDVTNTVTQLRSRASKGSSSIDPAKDFAETIRAQVRKATGCEVSIGISHNILLARLATRRAKPAGSYHLLPAEIPEFLAPLNIADLHGFGSSTRQKAQEKLGATRLGDLMEKSKGVLCDALGKMTGETLYNALRGIDNKMLESDKPRKSVSCEINYGIRFENNEQAEAFIYQMATEVTKRLDDIAMLGRSITLKIMKRDPTAPVEPPKFLGHGACDLYNKQIPLIGPGGRATSDERVIGEHAWRLLKSFNFDPKELRGIGIQIQKLEGRSPMDNLNTGQAVLPFARVENPDKTVVRMQTEPADGPRILVHAPSQDGDDAAKVVTNEPGPSKPPNLVVDLPSFSQVDMAVFNALPPDVREELEKEYKRRSTSPMVTAAPVPAPPNPPARSSVPPAIFPRKITVKGTNYSRITHQLAPRSRPPISPQKNMLFRQKKGLTTAGTKSAARMSDADLRALSIDPAVFAVLPANVQREQLVMARLIKANGRIPEAPSQRKVLKPRKPKPVPAHRRWRAPPPRARHVEPPLLRQQGARKGEKLYFTETDDIQRAIGAWVDGYRHWAPKAKDVEFFTAYLVASVDGARATDVGVERAVAIVKWWLVLLRRHWSGSELVEEEGVEDISQKDPVGEAWWRAFREVKEKMDVVARKRFGGRLSLK